jgi:transcriptional regulator with XRE-family HTH domain
MPGSGDGIEREGDVARTSGADGESGQSPPPSSRLAERLDFLFRHVRGQARGEYSYREVAHAIESAGGPSVSATYLMYLRKGQRTNPTLQHLEALAGFFGVPVTYFLEEATAGEVRKEIDLVATLRDDDLRLLALHVSELSPEGRAAVARMVEEIRSKEAGGSGADA